MKLFWRDHFSMIIFNIIQLFLVLSIYWMDGYHELSTALYSVFFGISLLLIYLLFRYVIYSGLYRLLSTANIRDLDEIIQMKVLNPLASSLQHLLLQYYQLYQSRIHQLEHQQRDHITFINQWVHQMKTPLSVIHLILKGKIDHESDQIHDEIDRMGKGLDMILYMSRLESFEPDFHVEPVVLRNLVSEVIYDNKRLLIRNEIYPSNGVDEQLSVITDAKWLRFIINQLVINAVKYSSGHAHSLKLISDVRDNGIMLKVQDEGIGIPKKDIERVFEAYYTGENGRKYSESTGMGLYLVSEICKRLNHDIQLKSTVGEGTTVEILFPIHK
ncbi:sensor histidine kinase [Paenibacillus polymyxa]|uniref:histidine kinase n=1 Tax=Paenibacillus polymyxa TaxID=1406 RepID=A0A378Y5J6_PAEPO|nr:sensor histidine kinase [Paenibacillus polymyxa]MBE7898736.1 sensor histidine kinase [Paenibacillus polymyxa]MBG9766776.1 membrane protein [Paenibacillus polymyxa]MCC3260398.1 sensor histidine kinase [Paenibacillus polymyxa]QPK53525.1 HAMP domain-containing histidine kinase [Paenibacillus polymyxa]QPK58604.1 HAMP domain-containing histidine kinase [Paenibacillus polymyxa]